MDKNNIFPEIIDCGNKEIITQKCALIEFVMIRKCVQTMFPVSVDEIIHETGLNLRDDHEILALLNTVQQRGIVRMPELDLYNSNVDSIRHLDVRLECDPYSIKEWAENAGLNDVYSFDRINEGTKNIMLGELTEKINHMKSSIKKAIS